MKHWCRTPLYFLKGKVIGKRKHCFLRLTAQGFRNSRSMEIAHIIDAKYNGESLHYLWETGVDFADILRE